MVAVGAWQCFLGGVGVEEFGGMRYSSPQEPYRPSASTPATADSICAAPPSPAFAPPPSVNLPFSTNPNPEKEKMGSVTKGRLRYRTVKE